MLCVGLSALRRGVVRLRDGQHVRGFKHSRLTVVENFDKEVRRKKTVRMRAENTLYGEPKWEDVQQKTRRSPGRKTLGRDQKGYSLGRKDALRGFKELDLVNLAEDEVSTRVQAHMRSRLKSGIPKVYKDGIKPRSRKVLLANEILLDHLGEALVDREIHQLNFEVCEVMEDPNALLELTRVEMSDDFLHCVVYWTIPFSTGVVSESVIEEIDEVLQRNRSKLRGLVVKRLQKRQAPHLHVKYDKEYEREERNEAQARRGEEEILDAMGTKLNEEWEFADDFNVEVDEEEEEDVDMKKSLAEFLKSGYRLENERTDYTAEDVEQVRKVLLREEFEKRKRKSTTSSPEEEDPKRSI